MRGFSKRQGAAACERVEWKSCGSTGGHGSPDIFLAPSLAPTFLEK